MVAHAATKTRVSKMHPPTVDDAHADADADAGQHLIGVLAQGPKPRISSPGPIDRKLTDMTYQIRSAPEPRTKALGIPGIPGVWFLPRHRHSWASSVVHVQELCVTRPGFGQTLAGQSEAGPTKREKREEKKVNKKIY